MDVDGNGTPETYTIRIANTSKPAECGTAGFSETACGFVIEFVDAITLHRMNPKTDGSTNGDGNKGGWEYSEMRTYLNNDIYNLIPSDLKNVIIDTETVVSGHGSNDSSDFITRDKLYLLSVKEVGFDFVYDSARTKTRNLDCYYGITNNTMNNKIKKYNNSPVWWWLRSAVSNSNATFSSVRSDGDRGILVSSDSYGVVPAFRIG